MAITIRSHESESLWKMPLWIFTSVRVCLSTLQLSIGLMMKSTICSSILNIFRDSVIHVCQIMSSAICNLFMPWLHFSSLF